MQKRSRLKQTATAPRQFLSSGEQGAAETLHLVLRLANKLMAPFSTYLERRYKISLNEFRLLMLIGRHPELASHELAEITGVTPMTVSRAVVALEKHRRIEVRRDPANKRRKILVLTDEGQRLFQIMQPQTEKVATYLVSELAETQVSMLNHHLDTLVATLEAKDEAGNSLFMEFTKHEARD